MGIIAFSGLVNAVTSIVLVLIILKYKPNLKWYAALNASIAYWSAMYSVWVSIENPVTSIFFIKLVAVGMVIVPTIFLEFSFEWSKRKPSNILRVILYGLVLFFMGIIFKTSLYISGMQVLPFVYFWPIAGALFPAYVVFYFACFLYGNIIIYNAYKNDIRFKYMLIATGLGVVGAATNFFYWFNIHIPPYGNYIVAIYVSIMCYAIVKHNLLDIRIAVSRAASSIVTLGIMAMLATLLYLKLNVHNKTLNLTEMVALICGSGVIFQLIYNGVYTPIEKRFLEGYYNIQKIIGDLSSDLIVSNNQVEILKLISKKLKEELETAESYFIYSHLEETTYKIYHHESESAVFSIENIQELEHVFFNKIEPIELKDLPKAAQKLAGPIPMSAMSLVVPIHSFEKLHGVMVLGQKLNKKRYNESDRAMIQATMNQLMVVFDRILYHQKMITLNNELNEKVAKQVKEIEEKRRLEKDLEVASQIQQQVLPSRVPKLYGHAIHAAFHPARMVSGDYYTFLMFSDHEIGIVIADIIGKGVTAAFQMMALNTIVHEVIQSTHTPKEACLRLNKAILENPIIKSYVPLIYAKLNTQTNTFTYCNAGHEEGLYKTGDDIKALTAGGSPLGADEIGVFDEEVLHLKDNDKIALFTDGLLDNRNKAGEGFGVDKMTHLMQRSQGRLGELIETEWCAFGDPNKPQKDDMTLIVIEHERVEIIEGSV